MQNFPIPPSDLSQFFPWLKAGATLLALFVLALRIPQFQKLADWVKGTIAVIAGTILVGIATYAQGHLPADTIASLQPYYEGFVTVLALVIGYFGAQVLLVKPVKAWWGYRQDLWAANINVKRAQLRLLATAPDKQMLVPLRDTDMPGL